MLSIIENYKRLTLSVIMANMNPESRSAPVEPEAQTEQLTDDDFKGNGLSDLRALKKAIEDGEINIEEAKIIYNNIDNIQEDAKEGLKEIADKMLENGFSFMNNSEYNAFRKLLIKLGKKLPLYKDILIKDRVFFKINEDKNFHGILVKGNTIKVRYDGSGDEDLYIMYFDEDGIIEYEGWKNKRGEDKDFGTSANISGVNLDDNIYKAVTKAEVEKTKNTELINWHLKKYTPEVIELIQKRLGVTANGIFGIDTLKKIQRISPYGKIDLGVLKTIELVDTNNNAINGLTKSMLKQPKTGDLAKITFKKDTHKKTSQETGSETGKKTSQETGSETGKKTSKETGSERKKGEYKLKIPENISILLNRGKPVEIGTYINIWSEEQKIILHVSNGEYEVELDGSKYLIDISKNFKLEKNTEAELKKEIIYIVKETIKKI